MSVPVAASGVLESAWNRSDTVRPVLEQRRKVGLTMSDVSEAVDVQSIERVLRERISSRTIPPGSKLKEMELAAEFNVSRAQVREVFAALALRGLIERIPNKGAVVVQLGFGQVAEIFAVREVLEGMCARLAAKNSTPSDWERHAKALEEDMPRLLAHSDFAGFLACYEAFRQDIIVHARNATLADMLDSIRDKIRYLARRIVILPGRAEQALQEHRAVLGALRAGDGVQAERLRMANMRSGFEWFERYRDFIL
ncbi:transcriptional regulator, GntR family [Acidovorax delafieldii 2AN]|uniref:Transcriptional regulator, GntR family n=1 Tax=Acidovorax delafieldii 2AN TaxID=573060 RepID=C5T787_ACIDE|nr:transcriptional regulator, GntR family [Acidovorax delafieldii 2AN]